MDNTGCNAVAFMTDLRTGTDVGTPRRKLLVGLRLRVACKPTALHCDPNAVCQMGQGGRTLQADAAAGRAGPAEEPNDDTLSLDDESEGTLLRFLPAELGLDLLYLLPHARLRIMRVVPSLLRDLVSNGSCCTRSCRISLPRDP